MKPKETKNIFNEKLELQRSREAYLGGLVVADDDGGVPLRSALGSVHLHPEANQDTRRRQQDTLAVLHLGPLSDRARP